MSDRRAPRGRSMSPVATRDNYASRDSDLPNDDRELSALIFALAVAGPFLVTAVVLFYLAT